MQKEPKSLPLFGKAAIVAVSLSFAICSPPAAFAQSDEEMDILRMIYKDQDLVTPTRSPKPISQVAENLTVIDAEDIEKINAHTLADVLKHVTGVQADISGGPGSISDARIQGSSRRQVRVVMDGVTLNNLSDNLTEIGTFPVQRIERIEIIKGPASSAWGSSLGGIINIITKNPDPARRLGGMASASIGERGTGDYRLDLAGTAAHLGYYLSADGMSVDGLTPNNGIDAGNFYWKFQLQPTDDLQLQYTQSYSRGERGDGRLDDPDYGPILFRDRFEYILSTLSVNYRLTSQLELNLSGRLLKQENNIITSFPELDFEDRRQSRETTYGTSVSVSFRQGINNALAGFDYDNGAIKSALLEDGKKRQERWAIFANDTITLGDFSVTPGIRYDNTSSNGNFISPSLGVTYALFDKTIFRAYAARGFNTPPLAYTFLEGASNHELDVEEVLSYSVGAETSAADFFWIKVSGFRHDVWDVIDDEIAPVVNSGRQRRQGVEAELRTVPLFHTSLAVGYSYIDATNRPNGERIPSVPSQTWDVGMDYSNSDLVNGSLRGHYIKWNSPQGDNGRYSAMIWDLNLSRRFTLRDDLSIEAFFTAHNLFNGSQYSSGIYNRNPRRWLEGGVRCRF